MDADGRMMEVLKIYFMYLYLSCTIIIKLSSKPEFVHTCIFYCLTLCT